MKAWLSSMSAVFAGVLLAIAAFAGFVYWRFTVWYNAPLGEPMSQVMDSTLQPDYTLFWGILIAVAGLAVCGLLAWIGVSLARLAKD